MSELKCPCCGNDLKETYLGYVCSNTSLKDPCSFRITKEQLPRISAAMEFARCIADSDIDWDEGHAKWLWDETKKARARVMEAFK